MPTAYVRLFSSKQLRPRSEAEARNGQESREKVHGKRIAKQFEGLLH